MDVSGIVEQEVERDAQSALLREVATASRLNMVAVASDALQIFGGNGLSREYPIEKLLRDARASLIEDGCNEVLSLVGAARL